MKDNSQNDLFENYCARLLEAEQNRSFLKFHSSYFCPCCTYPTLSKRCESEICFLCNWEDDGQDDPKADEIWGGANGQYSLSEARKNFEKYYTMYSPGDYRFKQTTLEISGFGKVLIDKVDVKKKIIRKFQEMYNTNVSKKERI